jgi:MYXO-CTERM domain-containing protein
MDRTHAAQPQPGRGALVGLLGLALFGLYVLALDQGWLLSLVQGSRAFDVNFIHEAVHDARHVAGFPCH